MIPQFMRIVKKGIHMKEYKVVEIARKYLKADYSFAEAAMNAEAARGWEVVSVSFDLATDIRGNMVITFAREKECEA